MPDSRELFWDKPLDLPVENAVHIAAGITDSTSYRAAFVPGETGADGKVPGRITLTPVRAIPNYLQRVPIDDSQPFSARWTPLAQALSSSRMYLDSHADDARSQSALAKVLQLDPMQHVEAEHEWLEELEWAVGRAPRSRIAQVAGTAEEAFVSHYGPTDSLAYVRIYDSMAFFQIGEVLAKFEVMNPAELVRASRIEQRVELVLEDGPGHGSANYFLVPMSAAFPAWMGTSSANVSYWVLFVLRTPRRGPLLDVWHRDKWRGWIGSWYKSGIWEPLDVPKPAEFVRWYIEHFNRTIQQLLDFNGTAALSGAIRPMSQLAMVRFFFHLHDLIGRLAMTSDPYARFMLSLTALDRFDALGWSYDTIANAGAMEIAMKPLRDDPEFGSALGSLAARTWIRSMRGLIEGSAGKPSDDFEQITLPNGRTMKTSAYLADFLRRLRNTIHTFDEEHLKSVLGSHSGRIPTSFAQFWVLLWIRLLVDPKPLTAHFRRP